jgi:hypothetical protein
MLPSEEILNLGQEFGKSYFVRMLQKCCEMKIIPT